MPSDGALSERERDYVYAASVSARAERDDHGVTSEYAVAPLLVQLWRWRWASRYWPEAGLSFLGLGTQPPDPSWGSMLNDSQAAPICAKRRGPGLARYPLPWTVLLVGLNYLSDAPPRRARPPARRTLK